MAIRSDVTVDWNVSPRIITVLAPSVTITLQDLHDTLIDFEDEPAAMTYEPLIRSEGKADLGGGVLTGITSTLLNSKLAFEARKTFVSTGTATTTDATGKILTDSGATFIADGVEPGAWIINQTTGEIASVLRITSETALVTNLIAGGFTSGDVYKLVNVTQCDINGGNLVAVDGAGSTVSPVLPTAGTQVKITAASSATLQEQIDIQYSAFGEAVHVNTTSSYSGTDYPIGTPRQPVNNLADALEIAEFRGFRKIQLSNAITLTGLDFSNYVFNGISPGETIVTIDSSANVSGCAFELVKVQGDLDGVTYIANSVVGTITNAKGFINKCVFQGNITLNATNPFVPMYIFDCSDGIAGSGVPIIDFNGAGCSMNVRGYRGGISFVNKSGADDVSIDGDVRVLLSSTITNGAFIIRGIGKVTDSSTGTTVDTTQLVNNFTIADQVWDEAAADHVAVGSMGELANSGGSLTPTQSTMLLEMYRLLGLDPTKPLVVTPTTRRVPANGADIDQTITVVGDDVTVQRV